MLMNGAGRKPRTELTLMMRPERWARMAGSTACVMCMTRKTFVSNRSRASSWDVSSAALMKPAPALLTRTSMRPARSKTVAAHSSTEAGSRTSRRTNSTFGCVAASPRTVPKVRNPISASRAAVAFPIPDETPVTRATFIAFLLEMTIVIFRGKKILRPACEGLDVHLPSGREEVAAQLLVVDRAGHGQRARHRRKQHPGLSPPLLLRRAAHEPPHRGGDGLDGPLHRRADHARLPRHLRDQRRDRAAAADVGAVLLAEVDVDEGGQLASRRRLGHRGPHSGAHVVKGLGERLGDELILALEVPVEAAVRHLQGLHQRADADRGAGAAETARRGVDDALSRLLLVIGRVAHSVR